MKQHWWAEEKMRDRALHVKPSFAARSFEGRQRMWTPRNRESPDRTVFPFSPGTFTLTFPTLALQCASFAPRSLLSPSYQFICLSQILCLLSNVCSASLYCSSAAAVGSWDIKLLGFRATVQVDWIKPTRPAASSSFQAALSPCRSTGTSTPDQLST